MGKPILCLDFDGVMHSYTSGWKGADVIPDPPVAGMVSFLIKAADAFDVHVLSSRSHQPGGMAAMKAWLGMHVRQHFDCDFGGSPHDYDRASALIDAIKWPTEKPAALVTIDDRAITFDGKWPKIKDLKEFQPWNKRQFGATGTFSQGQINDDDEGDLKLGIAYDKVDGIVRVEFGKPVAWLGLPPPQAIEFAKAIMTKAGARKIEVEF